MTAAIRAYLIFACGTHTSGAVTDLSRFGPICLFKSVAEDWIERRKCNPEEGDAQREPWSIVELDIIESSSLARHGA